MSESNEFYSEKDETTHLRSEVNLLRQRVAELQHLNEEKVRTIAEKDDHIVRLVNESLTRFQEEIRDNIMEWANEHDLDREFINGLLEGFLNMQPVPEWVEATVTIEATVLFRAGAGTPGDLSALYVENNVDFEMTAQPHYSSGLDFGEVRDTYVTIRGVETGSSN